MPNYQLPTGLSALLAIGALAIAVVLLVTGGFAWYLLAIALVAAAILV